MQEICIVSECGAEARHVIKSSKRPGALFVACTYHASGVYVRVGKLYGGSVSMSTAFALTCKSAVLREISSQRGQHELAS